MVPTSQMKVSIIGDFKDFERMSRVVVKSADDMSQQVSKTVDVARVSAKQYAAAFDTLRASIDPAFAATQRFAEFQRKLSGYVEQGFITQRQANLVQEQAASRYLGVATAAERAAMAQAEQTRAVASAKASYQSLRASIDPVYASSKRYEAGLETLNAALAQNLIGEREHARALQLLDAQLAGTGRQMGAAGTASARMSMAFSNASFQVQDFFVQIAAGTDWLRALSMQLPQLLGAFGFAGKLAMWGAGLGTLVAVGAAVAPMLFNMKGAADAAKEAVDDLSDAVARYSRYTELANKSQIELVAQFGSVSAEASQAAQILAQFAKIEAVQTMDAALKRLAETFGGLSDKMVYGVEDGPLWFNRGLGVMKEWQETAINLQKQLGITEAQALDTAGAMSLALSAQGKPIEDQVAAAVRLNDSFVAIFGSVERIPPQLQEVAKQALLLSLSAGEIVDPLERARAAGEKLSKAANGAIDDYSRQAELARAIAIHGEKSRQVEDLRRAAAMRTAEEYIKQNSIVGINAQRIRDAALESFNMSRGISAGEMVMRGLENAANSVLGALGLSTGETWNWSAAMSDVKAELYGILSALSQIGGGMIARSSKVIELNALRAGKSVAEARMEVEKFNIAATWNSQIKAAEGKGGVLGWAEKKALEAGKALDLANLSLDATLDAERKASAESERAAKKRAGAGADTAKKLAKELDREKQKWIDLIDPMARYRHEVEELARLKGYLTPEQMAKAQEKLNLQLAESVPLVGDLSNAWADFVMSGGKDISGLGDLFKQTLHQMIADAAKQQIMVSMGILPADGKVPAAGAAGGAPGLLGLGSLIGKDSWLGKGLASGKGFLGGIGKLFGFGGTSAGGAGMLGGLGSMLGTVGMIAGGIGLVMSLGKALFGRKLADTGVMGQFTGDTFDGSSYRYYKGGLFRSNKTSTEALDPQVSDTIGLAYADLRGNIRDMAGVLDLGSGAIADFVHDFKISTKDMSEDQVLQALQAEMAKAGAGMAELVLGTDAYTRAGETALDTLTRLSASLTGVRDVVDLLGHRFDMVGLVGGDVASSLADAFGGLDNMATATANYFQTFYTQEEQVATATRRAEAELARLGAAMPKSRAEYRLMVEALDLTDKKQQELYATLIGLSGVMDQVLPSIAQMTREMQQLTGMVSTGLDATIDATTEAQRAALDAARTWYRAAQSIRDYIDRLRGTAGALVSGQQALVYNEARYQAILARAVAGDIAAVGDLTGAADAMLASQRDMARNRVDLARAQARVLSDLGLVQGVADIEGARHDVIAGLLGQQIDVLTEVRDFLAGGGVLDKKQIDALNGQLGSLQGAIKAAEMINYAFLKERLAVAVDVIADAKVPAYLKSLLSSAAGGIESHIDFITRSDLSPDMKWLALTGTSEHIKTVDYLARNELGTGLTKLALTDVSVLQKTVHLLVGAKLPADLMRIALAGNSELARVVTATLAANISPEAKRLALGNVGAYAVTVNASLSTRLPASIRRIVLEGQGGYAAMIDAAISADMGDQARRILLRQQGRYIANIAGVLASNMAPTVQRLLLQANTEAVRSITIRRVFGEDLTAEDRRLLREAETTAWRTITAAIDLAGVGQQGRLFLAQLGVANGAVLRTIRSAFDLTAMNSPRKRSLLDAVDLSFARTVLGRADLSGLGPNALKLLDAATVTIIKTLKGRVDLSSLNERQKGLLDAITGATPGKITLGGSFRFDPSKSFTAWYEDATTANITDPMKAMRIALSGLGGSLADLRKVIVAEGNRQERAAKVAALDAYVGTLTRDGEGRAFVNDAELARMAEILGLDTTGMDRDTLRRRVSNFSTSDLLRGTVYDPSGKKEKRYLDSLTGDPKTEGVTLTLDDFRIFRRQYGSDDGRVEGFSILGPLGGIRGTIGPGGAQFTTVLDAEKWLKDQKYPAFARGGQHSGGPAYIGENDLELVAPSRVYSPRETREMLDNRAVVEAITELRREVAAARAENTQLLLRIEGYERQQARIVRDWDANGLPAERTE